MKQTQLFGTDGIRGSAGEYPLDRRTVLLAGRALGQFLRRSHAELRVLLGEDTRESSRWIAEQLAGGLAREGVASVSAGIITTPGLAYLSRINGFSAGVMISASHNPYRDNGIKVFAHSGYKLPDENELEVEENLFRLLESAGDSGTEFAAADSRLQPDESLRARYEDFLCSLLPKGMDFRGLRIALDCANGAASAVAPELFARLGARVTAIHASPDGRNINLECGSLHPEQLQARVPAEQADMGIAFDGDADRALFVTSQGRLVDGDGVLFVAARHMAAQHRLRNQLVVGTVMANLGLEVALERDGIRLLRTPVGDKYVLEEMLRRNSNLGGEQSGHIIFSDDHTTGDGLLTALRLLEIVKATGRPLHDLVSELRVYPQLLVNVRVREKVPVEQLPEVGAAIRAAEQHFGTEGRVIVRYSGTERLARVMVEGREREQVERHAGQIAAAFRSSIGA
jgi:phosphoglucosamine mutase